MDIDIIDTVTMPRSMTFAVAEINTGIRNKQKLLLCIRFWQRENFHASASVLNFPTNFPFLHFYSLLMFRHLFIIRSSHSTNFANAFVGASYRRPLVRTPKQRNGQPNGFIRVFFFQLCSAHTHMLTLRCLSRPKILELTVNGR